MDKCSSDAEFDSYWDYEAKNKNRNRIRVGRQYQATIPPLLKPGEKDGRKCEELETLKWKPEQLSDQEFEQYLSMAKGVALFAKAVDNPRIPEKADNSLQSAIKGLSEFVASHHPCHHDDGCQVPKPSSSGESASKINVANDWSPSEAQLFAQALEACGKNFCAIKKEFLPWKPVRSIIEYYYQGKNEKLDVPSESLSEVEPEKKELVPKEEDESVASSSPEKSSLNEVSQCEDHLAEKSKVDDSKTTCEIFEPPNHLKPSENLKSFETLKPADNSKLSENLRSSENLKPYENLNSPENLKSCENFDAEDHLQGPEYFLESRVTDHCKKVPDLKMSVCEGGAIPASTVGSLNFFLGGRLVLKLNAQQDSGSGTKCQWVQSNDLPKHSNPAKKLRHKKKFVQDGSFTSETHKQKKKTDELSVSNRLSDCDSSAVKKPKLKSEFDFTDIHSQGLLLCSSSWTPPVADGHESVEMDDGSSKTSEGYISPVLSNPRSSKADLKSEFASNINSVNELGEQKCDSDPCWVKYEPRGGSVPSENSNIDDSASKSMCFLGGKHSPNQFDDSSFKQEVLNHKSALSQSKPHVKSPCYQPRTSHSSSPLLKQWNKWSSIPYPVKTSPSSLSPVSLIDSKSPIKDIPLDLSSKLDNSSCNVNHRDPAVIHRTIVKVECQDKTMPCESDSQPASSEFSPQSSNLGSHPQSVESPKKETNSSYKCSEDVTVDQQQYVNAIKKEDNEYSPGKSSGDSSQLPYTYCNLPYHCALPKCTKDYSLEEHLCNKSNTGKSQDVSPGYIISDVDENMCKKNPAWCNRTMASYFQFYPQCYPYYLTYGMAPSPVSEHTTGEVPLDLSSANESIKERTSVPEIITENVNDVSAKSTEAVERGMLYQLLKNKTSK